MTYSAKGKIALSCIVIHILKRERQLCFDTDCAIGV